MKSNGLKYTIVVILLMALITSFGKLNGCFIKRQDDRNENYVKEALTFCEDNNYSTEFAILVDMQIHSGKNRFMIWNLKEDTLLKSFLVSHGCGELPWGEDLSKTSPKFSNVEESHLSSLGKYKIGKRGYSNWGVNVNYKLHGLDASNSNAYKRIIILHSWDMISEKECYPSGTPEGWGCPAINNEHMKWLDTELSKINKPVLLWIYK